MPGYSIKAPPQAGNLNLQFIMSLWKNPAPVNVIGVYANLNLELGVI